MSNKEAAIYLVKTIGKLANPEDPLVEAVAIAVGALMGQYEEE